MDGTAALKNKKFVILGGTGFIGRYVVEKLAHHGATIIVPTRHPGSQLFLKSFGYPGQIRLCLWEAHDQETLKSLLSEADTVINLVGILNETSRQTYEELHHKLPAAIGKIAQSQNLNCVIHLSALGARPGSNSSYQRTKAAGEKALLKSFKTATILRPSTVFGPEDLFLNRLAKVARLLPVIGLVKGGSSKSQPVYVGDIAEAIVKIVLDQFSPESKTAQKHKGVIYECGGPCIYTLREIVLFVLDCIKRPRYIVEIPFVIGKIVGLFYPLMPNLLFSAEELKLMQEDNIVNKKEKTLKDLGIVPQSMEARAPYYLKRYQSHA